jgi:hypothetical protein
MFFSPLTFRKSSATLKDSGKFIILVDYPTPTFFTLYLPLAAGIIKRTTMIRFFLASLIFSGSYLFQACGSSRILHQPGDKLIEATKKKKYFDHIYFFDSAGYANFITEEAQSFSRSMIYGFFHGDTLMKKPDGETQEVPACLYLMTTELKNHVDTAMIGREYYVNKYIFTEHLVKMDNLKRYVTGQFANQRITVFLFSLDWGKKFDRFFAHAVEISKAKNSIPIIISMDPVCYGR